MDNLQSLPDHDILILVSGQVQNLAKDIRELKDNHTRRVEALELEKINKEEVYRMKGEADDVHDDHESRIRRVEREQNNFKGKYAIVAILTVTVLSGVVSLIINKL